MSHDLLAVYCVDVGSIPKGKFGWARVCSGEQNTGSKIDELALLIARDLQSYGVALGFECPLFVPLHGAGAEVLCCRPGENDRPWSASAGIASLGAGLVESTWLLRRVFEQCQRTVPVFIRSVDFQRASQGLFLWEAFVTGKRNTTHEQDALAAAHSFQCSWPHLEDALPCKGIDVISLIGLAAIRSGWSDDVDLLQQKPVVINPNAKGAPL